MNTLEVGVPHIDKGRVTVPLTPHGSAARLFVRENFWSEYSLPVDGVSPGILAIPAVACLLPLAWAEDVVLRVRVLDYEFSRSIPSIRQGWGASTRVVEPRGRVDVVRESDTEDTGGSGAALLFRGGVDSERIERFHRKFADGRLLLKPSKLHHWGVVQAHIPPGSLDGALVQIAFLGWLRTVELIHYRSRRRAKLLGRLRGWFGALVQPGLRSLARRTYLGVSGRW